VSVIPLPAAGRPTIAGHPELPPQAMAEFFFTMGVIFLSFGGGRPWRDLRAAAAVMFGRPSSSDLQHRCTPLPPTRAATKRHLSREQGTDGERARWLAAGTGGHARARQGRRPRPSGRGVAVGGRRWSVSGGELVGAGW
jgi:hypothetical protein